MRLLPFLLAFIACLPLPSFSQSSMDIEPIKVLLIHSYSETQSWTYDQNQGFLDVLKGTPYNYDITIEYMDTKRHYSDEYFECFRDFFISKHVDHDFDLIAVTDDNALSFMLSIKNIYFEDTPLFFSGVNALNPYDFSAYNYIYGIRENISLEETVDVITTLQPNISTLYFLFDDSNTAKITIEDIRVRMKDSPLNIEVITPSTLNELKNFVSAINDPSIALIYGFFMVDKQGIAYDPHFSAKILTQVAKQPIYGLWTFSMDSEVIGGKLVSGYSQGQKMGELIINYLVGQLDTPFLDSSLGNKYVFDYSALKKHNLNIKLIPIEADFINKPKSFYEQHKPVLLTSFAISTFLILYISILIKQISKKTKEIEETTSRMMEFKRQASLTHLVTGIAHDINTPIGNITMLLDYTKRLSPTIDDYDTKLVNSLNHIETSVNQINTLINKFKRISTEFYPHHTGDLLLTQSLNEIVTLTSSTFDIPLTFNLNCDANLTLPLSKGTLYDIFEPLVDNSFEHGFANAKSGTIWISVVQNKLATTISYEDDGVGLLTDCDQDIFEPFYSTAKNYKHSGLGLFGVKTTLSAYGGTIECVAKKEEGAKFIITLPLNCTIYK